MEQKEHLDNVLAALDIDGKCVHHSEHRHMAFYDVALNPGATMNRLERRTREIALGIRSKTTPLVKLLSKEGVVRLQVATSEADTLPLSVIFTPGEVPEDYFVPILLGESDEGKKLWIDLSKHPHTLIAGGTGSGKSILLHTIISNIARLNYFGLRNIELYLCDPKNVEFNAYDGVDFVVDSANTYEGVLGVLENLNDEMEARYAMMAEQGINNIQECPWMNTCVLIIDEVADLMLQDHKSKSKALETMLVKLAQKSRAAGIFIILATQRPSVDVLTGLIKANFPARISCKVATRIDSQVILDTPGAECLLGRGDAVLQSPVIDRARFQVAYTDPKDITEWL